MTMKKNKNQILNLVVFINFLIQIFNKRGKKCYFKNKFLNNNNKIIKLNRLTKIQIKRIIYNHLK